jgi:hypothetical protein
MLILREPPRGRAERGMRARPALLSAADGVRSHATRRDEWLESPRGG